MQKPLGIRPRIADTLPILGVLLLATWTRLNRLDLSSLWVDEIGQVQAAMHPWSTFFESVRGHHAAVPIAYVVQKLWLPMGTSEFAVRFPSVFFGILTVALVYRLGKDTRYEHAGLLSALVALFLPQLVYYNREARFYSMAAFLSALFLFALVHAARKRNLRAWGVHALVGTVGQLTHGFFVFNYLGQATWLVVEALRDEERTNFFKMWLALLVSMGVTTGVFALWWFLPLPYTAGGLHIPQVKFSPALIHLILKDVGGWDLLRWQGMVFWGFVAVGALRLVRTDRRGYAAAFYGMGLIIPAAIIADNRFRYFFSSRQVISIQPMIALLAGVGGSSIVSLVRRHLTAKLSSLPALFAVILLGSVMMPPFLRARDHLRTDWRLVAQVLRQAADTKHELFWYAPAWVKPCLYYYGTNAYRYPPLTLNSLTPGSPTVWGIGTSNALLPLRRALRDRGREWVELDLSGAHILISPTPGKTLEKTLDTLAAVTVTDRTGVWSLALANGYRKAGNRTKAEAMYQQAISASITKEVRVKALHDYGIALLRNGRRPEALDVFMEAHRLNPDNVEVMAQIGYTYLVVGQYTVSAQWFTSVLRRAPEHYWAHRFLGEDMEKLGRYQEAAAEFERAWDLRKTDSYVLVSLANAKWASGDSRAACADWRQYLGLAPGGRSSDKVKALLSVRCGLDTSGSGK